MQFRNAVLIFFITLCSAFQLNASSCKDYENLIVQQGKDRFKNKQQKAAWENFQILKDNFGEPIEKKPIEFKLYLWKNYATITRDGVPMEWMGDKSIHENSDDPWNPKKIIGELTKKLGAPEKVQSQILTNVTWTCEKDTIVALVDDTGTVIDITVAGQGMMGLNAFKLQEQLTEYGKHFFNNTRKP